MKIDEGSRLGMVVAAAVRAEVEAALAEAGGNATAAAKRLGVSYATLRRLIARARREPGRLGAPAVKPAR